ncbi:MAG: hypothetical protein LUM44_22715 [Pyrinomonadaceae bacterium]|nr:hypothetical protein [Pyrinomonadaceae bacterium]
MRNKFFLTAFMWLVFGSLSAIQAQTASTFANFSGKISAINIESGEITLLTAENVSFTVNTKNVTDIRQVSAGATTLQDSAIISVAQISVDDRVLVRGKLSDKNVIAAKQIIVIKKDDLEKREALKREDWKKRGIAGTVVKTDATNKKISVLMQGQTQPIDISFPNNVVIQRYQKNAANLNDFKPSNFEEIKEGDQIRVLGNKSSDGLQMNAEEIFVGSFNTRVGKVVSIDLQNNELKIAEPSNKTISVSVNPESIIRRVTPDTAANGKARTNEANGKINLTGLQENLPKINLADIKVGEIIAVASSSDSGAEKILGLVMVTGIDSLMGQSSKKSSNKTFNLDVF